MTSDEIATLAPRLDGGILWEGAWETSGVRFRHNQDAGFPCVFQFLRPISALTYPCQGRGGRGMEWDLNQYQGGMCISGGPSRPYCELFAGRSGYKGEAGQHQASLHESPDSHGWRPGPAFSTAPHHPCLWPTLSPRHLLGGPHHGAVDQCGGHQPERRLAARKLPSKS